MISLGLELIHADCDCRRIDFSDSDIAMIIVQIENDTDRSDTSRNGNSR